MEAPFTSSSSFLLPPSLLAIDARVCVLCRVGYAHFHRLSLSLSPPPLEWPDDSLAPSSSRVILDSRTAPSIHPWLLFKTVMRSCTHLNTRAPLHFHSTSAPSAACLSASGKADAQIMEGKKAKDGNRLVGWEIAFELRRGAARAAGCRPREIVTVEEKAIDE